MIGILKSGNYRSVYNALAYLGFEAAILQQPDELKPSYRALVVPGNGNFQSFMERLQQSGWKDTLLTWIKAERPYLGICIGFQILFETSEETITVRELVVPSEIIANIKPDSQLTEGLGIIPGSVKKIQSSKVPLIGWNYTTFLRNIISNSYQKDEYFYYIHSYYAACSDPSIVVASATYENTKYCAGIAYNSITAFQFHPERSGIAGLSLLQTWANTVQSPSSISRLSRYIGG
ncbi:MAG TPA: imidazole glycerol phosphate synthase subunit HisH [Spirochaetia bacterium]|nr:imidazole glycerol phosphate synthase subunit HisH [Spirochaetales bacterium]HRS66093.1 imidazole glycerol phosphate synthase subunit HisH [Spirochaetia bacterium]HOT59883.1 imidazole glycerol phosphate synthase subunit HisH [Spirochaetales bacterium]HPD79880.1 imidazole glycerol phosphate synthase subunit HisH [Spirochaetales bacterium]HQK33265.1 imidazole glycerol phosphate synthase subunit HisH [Spirochaetales bacterium]